MNSSSPLILLFLLLAFPGQAQKIERGYDYYWKETTSPPRVYAFIEKKDSVWHMKAYFLPEKSMAREANYRDDSCKIKHGSFTEYYPTGRVKSQGMFINDREEGVWLRYHQNGMMRDSATYKQGQLAGLRLGWHETGDISDSCLFDNNGNGMAVMWAPDGSPSRVGGYTGGKMQGQWKILKPGGKVLAVEDYQDGEKTATRCFDDNGKPFTGEDCGGTEAAFAGGARAWVTYLQKNLNADVPLLHKAPNGTFTVAVQFIVDTNGRVMDVKALTNFGFGMEKEAVRILKASPLWVPAVLYGRKVKAYRIQPITFAISG